jgi:RNA polymerase sigma-70 factor, ECF subfamily
MIQTPGVSVETTMMVVPLAFEAPAPAAPVRLGNGSRLACGGFARHNWVVIETNDEAAALIEAIALNGDRDAFEELFDHYAPRIKTFLIIRGAGERLAEDLAQEAMLSVWRKAASFDRTRATASAWIFTIARNLGIDHFRRDQRAKSAAYLEAADAESPARPDDILIGNDIDEHVRTALLRLRPEQLKVVELSFYEGKAHGEISETLNIPLGTVKSRLRLAFGRLRELLDELS